MAEPYVGQIICVGFPFTPSGYVQCNGQLLSINDNEVLYTILGTTYGGDGQTTFGVPDLRGRTPIHQGTGSGGTMSLGSSGGTETVTLNTTHLPVHTHGITTQTDTGSVGTPAGNYFAGSSDSRWAASGAQATGSVLAANAAGSQSHQNLQPFLCVNFVIATQGVYPSQS